MNAPRVVQWVEFRCGRGHPHRPSAGYDVGNGTCHCTIGPCRGIFDSGESLIRRVSGGVTGYVRDEMTAGGIGRKEGT